MVRRELCQRVSLSTYCHIYVYDRSCRVLLQEAAQRGLSAIAATTMSATTPRNGSRA